MKFSSVRFLFLSAKQLKLKYGGSPKTRLLSWSEAICSNFVGSSLLWEGFYIRFILVSQAFTCGLGAKIEERESRTARKMTLVPFLARPKPKIFSLGLSLLRSQTETLATQAKPFPVLPPVGLRMNSECIWDKDFAYKKWQNSFLLSPSFIDRNYSGAPHAEPHS